MRYKVKPLKVFERQAKRLIAKYPSLRQELAALGALLEQDPEQGTPLGRNCFKIRLAIASKGKGKSGGARVITNIVVREDTVHLLTIYDKSEQADLSEKALKALIALVPG
jgi:mRNA-degrading endonuclease RelE of RelBE toxin-antitoxin system